MGKEVMLSIITVCYNAESYIRKTMNSILEQMVDGMEHIIIDGSSKDNTLLILESFRDRYKEKGIPYSVTSEPDKGIYDAMNKGLVKANGKWVNFLNAGDFYYSNDVLKKVIGVLRKSDADIIYGKFKKVNPYFNEIQEIDTIEKIKTQMIFCHQALFVRRQTHLNFKYNTKYKIVSDYNTFLKMYLAGKKFEYLPIVMVEYDLSGISAHSTLKTFKEICEVRRDNHVIDNRMKTKVIVIYGFFRRWCIDHIPTRFRWFIVKMKRKFRIGESIY